MIKYYININTNLPCQIDLEQTPSYINKILHKEEDKYVGIYKEITQAEYEALTATPEPVEPVLTKKEQYKELVIAKIRSKYSLEDEIALNRQKETKPQEFNEYFDFCEKCKADAKKEINK